METLIIRDDKKLKYFQVQVETDEETGEISQELVFKREIPNPEGTENDLEGEELLNQMH
jgi:hypothetical protein